MPGLAGQHPENRGLYKVTGGSDEGVAPVSKGRLDR